MPALVPDPGINEQLFKVMILDQLILRGAHCASSGPGSRYGNEQQINAVTLSVNPDGSTCASSGPRSRYK